MGTTIDVKGKVCFTNLGMLNSFFISFITTQHQDTQYNILNAHDI
jgi:hypothetical protein